MKKPILIAPFLGCALFVVAQSKPACLLQIHLDPYNEILQATYLRNEVRFVDYVFDRRECDVLVQGIYEPTGNGAARYRYFFYGNGAFAGQNDTIVWHTDPAENSGSIREKSLQAFKRGLLPYLLQTTLANALEYQITDSVDNADTYDPWRRWTFNPQLNIRSRGQFFRDENPLSGKTDNRISDLEVDPSFFAFHIGHTWRVGVFSGYEYGQRKKTTMNEGTNSHVQNHVFRVNAEVAYSLSQHWSVGADVKTLSLKNYKIGIYSLGFEYNAFPYRDFFRQNCLVGYHLNVQSSSGSKPLLLHRFLASYSKVEKWGYVRATSLTTFRTVDREWGRFDLNGELSVGLNLGKNVFFTTTLYAELNNQDYSLAYLTNPVVVQSRNARSGSYNFSCGIAYFFGSGYRNIVNPRLLGMGIAIF